MLGEGDLASARAAAEEALCDAALVERWSGSGWSTVGTFACAAVPKRTVTDDGAGQLIGVTLWSFRFSRGADVRPNDRLRHAERTYVVSETDAGRTDALLLVAQATRNV
ncbi:MAG TPA: hypothetical protein VLH79_07615 [Chthonomonadales bacterium]|nr:hypothetical protein [Chthonomonadales bacterium]